MRHLLLPPVLLLAACSAPSSDNLFVNMAVETYANEAAVNAQFVDYINDAEDSLIVALPHGEDLAIPEAIIAKHESGLDVKVITDIDAQNDAGIVALLDAGVRVRLAGVQPTLANPEGNLTYFDFNANRDVTWTSEQVLMSHAFVVRDDLQLLNATSAGNVGGGAQVIYRMRGEDLADDFWLEHNQIFGGSDATALTAFSSPAKSQADIRWLYPTNTDTPYELWLGPQERVTKRVIDAIYSSRKSVRVLTNVFANDGLAQALQEKSSWGFDVEIIVGPDYLTSFAELRQIFERRTPDVAKYRFDTVDGPVPDGLDDADGDGRYDGAPTIVLIDIEGGVNEFGLETRPRAYVISHDLYSASRFYVGTQIAEVTTDQLIDGNLNVLTDFNYRCADEFCTSDSPMQPLVDTWYRHLNASGGF